MLIIGSKAAEFWFEWRKPADIDVICTLDELKIWASHHNPEIVRRKYNGAKYCVRLGGRPIEFEIATEKSSAYNLMRFNQFGPLSDVCGYPARIASPSTLMAIKWAHLIAPIRWWKHIRDYHHLKSRGIILSDGEKEIAIKRRKETARRIRAPKPNLNLPNEEFFGKSSSKVKRYCEHDDLHLATCYYDRPLYERVKYDLSKAKLEKSLFNKLSHLDKIRLVQEECYAIALERYIIPTQMQGGLCSGSYAFKRALERICTTLTSGWFRDFAIDHVPEIVQHNDYVKNYQNAVADGRLILS